jgi:hypothetical protein
MNRIYIFVLVCFLAVVASACGDIASEAVEECKSLGPRCDNGVAINCEVLCSMLDCSAAVFELTCANGAQCSVRPAVNGTGDSAYCVVQPETTCDSASADMHKGCPSSTSVKLCDFNAGVVVSYECGSLGPNGGAIPTGCDSQENSKALICKP